MLTEVSITLKSVYTLVMVKEYVPIPVLQPYISRFLFIEAETDMQNCILPDTAMVLAIRYSGSVATVTADGHNELPVSVLSGLRREPRTILYNRGAANLLIIFKPGGAAAFVKEPMHQLFKLSCPTNSLSGFADIVEIAERIADLTSADLRVGLIQQLLLKKLINPQQDNLVIAAAQKIALACGNVSIKSLAQRFFINQDGFEKRFRKTIGTTPKHFASIIRMQKAINDHSYHLSLTETALAAGYYDQAHFNKDFKLFTGTSPRQFFALPKRW